MDLMQDTMWKTYESINGWIKFSDTKAAAILAANGAILAIIFSKSIDNVDFILDNQFILISLSLGFLFGLISIIFALLCLRPTLCIGEPNSLIYFGHIAKKYDSCNRYKIDVAATFRDESGSIDQITSQVWANSKIAWKKYVNVTWAILFFIGVIFFLSLAGIKLLYLAE
jgi:hypothetical protein